MKLKKQRMYRYLINFYQFRRETLNLLNSKNLEKLAADYGFRL